MTLYKDIMPYFDKFIHVCGSNLSILWSPFRIWTPKILKFGNFGHPVSKSWLRPWIRAKFHLQKLPKGVVYRNQYILGLP